MSVSGARRAKELTEKYAAMTYGRKEEKLVKSLTRIRFCPRCGSYVPPKSKCSKCGYELDEHTTAGERR